MSKGADKLTALNQSISEIDGVFTYLIVDMDSIGFAKDNWEIKPPVSMGDRPEVAVARKNRLFGASTLKKATSKTMTGPR